MIYFDTAASYPVLSEVNDSLKVAFEQDFANSSSSHILGEAIQAKMQLVREQIADKIGCYPSEIIFTSGATESNNIAFKSLLPLKPLENKRHIITSQIEHKCIFSICNYLRLIGYEVEYLKPNKQGIIEPESVLSAIRPDTALVSIMHVNNELGTINPIEQIGELCHQANILFHTDAAQSFCKLDIDVDDMNIDVMSISAHKIGGPKGIGAVYIRELRKRELIPVIHGAGQEERLRGGTVASPLISGFGSAIKHFPHYYESFKLIEAKDYFCEMLSANGVEYLVNGQSALPHIVSITLPKTNVGLVIRENENSFCLAQGSACSSKEIEPSHVLSSLGLNRELANNTLRISFTLEVSKSDIKALVEKIADLN